MRNPRLSATKLVLVLPALGLAVTSLVVSVGLAPTKVGYAEIYGGPTGGKDGFYGRAVVLEEEAEIVRPVSGAEMRVGVRSGGRIREVLATAGSDGAVDFAIEGDLSSEARDVWVHDAKGGVLVEGRLEARKLSRLVAASRRGGSVALEKKGEVPLEAVVETGVLAAPFRGRVLLRLRGEFGADVRIAVSFSGAKLEGDRERSLEGKKELVFEVTPLGHDVEFECRLLRNGSEIGKARGRIPVVPGAFFPEFSRETVKVRSPIPREFVHYTWHTESSRLSSGRAALVPERDGTASASIPRLARDSSERLYLVLASDPDGSGAGTVGFPLTPGTSTLDRRDELLLTGRASSLAVEKRRTTRLRRALVLYVGLLFALSFALFVTILRRSAIRLEADLSTELEGPVVSPQRGMLLPTLVIALGLSGSLLWFAFLAR